MKPSYEKFLKKITNTKGLVIILLIGVGLMLIPGLFTGKQKTKTEASPQATAFDYPAYEKELEKRLAEILNTIQGVHQVSVMITLEDSGQVYYARNETVDEKNTEDGSLSEQSMQADGSLALKNDVGGGQSPVLLKTGLPRVSGVLVTAKGVENPNVQAAVIGAVRAVLNVSAHRVQVLSKA